MGEKKENDDTYMYICMITTTHLWPLMQVYIKPYVHCMSTKVYDIPMYTKAQKHTCKHTHLGIDVLTQTEVHPNTVTDTNTHTVPLDTHTQTQFHPFSTGGKRCARSYDIRF